MHTLSGLLHADHRVPSLDYETILKASLWLTKDVRECEKLFRQAVFNVLTHNRDDHAKNFSFLMDENGKWQLSPAYDLIFSSGPAGEHCTTLMGEGKHFTLQHFLKLATSVSIPQENAIEIINQVKAATTQWNTFAKQASVSLKSMNMIQAILSTT
jgi:serine/threonine-protein kinase HipA